MHGLMNRAIECFVRDTYGRRTWSSIARAADLEDASFESMLTYDETITDAVLDAAAKQLDKPLEVFLEDLGTYLVSHPTTEALRRLLRFGGVSFYEFLNSLDELPGRARLAVSDLELPELELHEESDGNFLLHCRHQRPGFGHVLTGVLRAMADDYGALVLLDMVEQREETEVLSIVVLETAFAEGRRFQLAAGEK
jgi:Haem-NO-binding